MKFIFRNLKKIFFLHFIECFAILVVQNAICILWPLKWRQQVAKTNFCFIQTTLNFLLYHMPNKLFGYLQYPRSGALCRSFVLKNDLYNFWPILKFSIFQINILNIFGALILHKGAKNCEKRCFFVFFKIIFWDCFLWGSCF